ncbi:MAG: OadG family protein [Tissierellia bacterium]|nr:OadG family protein [Tissierellia bacterium]MDD4437155.1 OadG family protein [Tissierellia bacterium]
MLFSETMTMGERFMNSLAVTVLGMLVVFTVLVIIAFSLNLLKTFFGEKEIKKKFDDGKVLVEAKENTNIAQYNSKTEVDTDLLAVLTAAIAVQNSDEIIAVLTAAVLAQSGSTEQIIIKSIVPIKQKSSIWASAGRQEQMLKTI